MIISFDRVADIYDRTRGFPDHAMVKITEFLKMELKNQERILDVGGGTGRFTKPLQDAGLEVVGVDISEKMLDKAREKDTKNLIIGDIRALPFHDKKFNTSVSVHALHLIKEWIIALAEISRVTKESLITVARDSSEYEKTPSGMYKELLKDMGYLYEHPGIGEWVMKDIIKPTKRKFITSYESNVAESIDFLNEKVYSFQWNAPDTLHERAMAKLRKAFARTMKYASDVYLYEWDIDELKEYLKAESTQVEK